MATSWQEAYRDFDSMTVPELKELLKSKDMPVSGKKIDLIQYLIFAEYPEEPYYSSDSSDLTEFNLDQRLPDFRLGPAQWLKLKYEEWLDSAAGFLAMGRSFDAINYQDIYS